MKLNDEQRNLREMQQQLDLFVDLQHEVGDAYFSICDGSWDECFRSPYHPAIIRLMDCEKETIIDIESTSIEETRKAAEALLKLLNGEFKEVCNIN